MDLSVICPVYNNVNNMLPMIASFQAQDVGDYEVEYIFVCNGCKDNSENVLLSLLPLFPDTFKHYQILHEDNGDTGIARQIGVENAIGDYILFCDMDDWLLSRTMFKELLDEEKHHPRAILHFGIDLPKKDWFFIKNGNLMYMTYWRLKYIMTCTVWQYMFPRWLFVQIAFEANRKGEDDLFFTNEVKKLARNKEIEILHINKDYYYWDAMNPKSYSYWEITTKCTVLTKEQFLELIKNMKPENMPEQLRLALDNLL